MEKTIKITQCDVCKRKEEDSYEYLKSDGWTKYKYKRDWQSGAHGGELDVELCVCNECDNRANTMSFFLDKIKDIISRIKD